MTVERRNHGRGHSYYIDGIKADSVTELLSDGTPKHGLIKWAARTVAEYVADHTDAEMQPLRRRGRDEMINELAGLPTLRRNEAARRGTSIHSLAEKLMRGEEVAVREELVGHARSAIAFMNDWQVRPILVERVVASRSYGYCGTPDLIADVAGRRAIVDYKSGNSGIWPEAALQLAAYRYADCYLAEGVEIPMTEVGIEIGYGVHLRSDGYDVHEVECGPDVFRCWLAVMKVARSFTRDGRAWIGDAQYRRSAVAA